MPGFTRSLAALVAGTVLAAPVAAQAFSVHLLLERDVSVAGEADLELISYAGFDDFVADAGGAVRTLPQAIGAASVGGLIGDGSVRFLIETDVDAGGGTDLFLVSHPSLDDLVADTAGARVLLPQRLLPEFSVAGLMFDGAYHLLLESDDETFGQTELFLTTYATLDDLLIDGPSTRRTLPQRILADFSISALAFDGAYHLLVESDDQPFGRTELFLVSYASFDDLIIDGPATRRELTQPIDASVSVAGLLFLPAPTTVVPTPAAGVLLLGALGGLAALRRRRRG